MLRRSWIVSGVFGFLLLSAVNTAIVDLIAISFLMSRDRELPGEFEKLNRFGVPNLGLIVATVIPALLVVAVQDVAGLADLYAVGVVGAIATNLGATSTDKKLDLRLWERTLMFCTFIIMAAIELSLFVDKPNARLFAATILVFGLILRGLVTERAQKKALSVGQVSDARKAAAALSFTAPISDTSGPPMLCAVRGIGRTLDFALQEARKHFTRRDPSPGLRLARSAFGGEVLAAPGLAQQRPSKASREKDVRQNLMLKDIDSDRSNW